eukprot:TRINITY_DN5163_c0_g1_i2.p1 TRINITY_DN5163_c0_g1~~TRINITY_DN5163_c0_g1_i2.p1  ORF type:complete len:619 (+),score=83.93 TRINITY_DN5163_c0_g1_i2:209-2065(+)
MQMPGSQVDGCPGVVQEWNHRGYGFIQLADGRRAYVHNSALKRAACTQGRVDLRQGEAVTAVVTEDPQNLGKWCCTDVWRDADEGASSGIDEMGGANSDPSNGIGGSSFGLASGGSCGPDVGGGDGLAGHSSRLEGVVTEWTDRGYGYIDVPDGQHVYVHHSAIGGGNLHAGERVSFSLAENPRNPLKSMAVEVQRIAATKSLPKVEVPAYVVGPQHPASLLQQVAKLPTESVVKLQRISPAEIKTTSERLEAAVTEWSERGFGFIQVNADKRRAYVHVSGLEDRGNLVVGELVTAEIVEDQKNEGKWQARAVRRGPAGENCVVTEWYSDKGYGFVQLEDGRRAYIHSSSFGGGDLVIESRLRVITKQDPRNAGKWCVSEVRAEMTADGSTPVLPHVGEELASIDLKSEQGPPRILGEPAVVPQRIFRPPQSLGGATGGGAGASRAAAGQDLISGTVTSWDARGFGFVQTDDGRRVYVHTSAFGGGDLVEGERLRLIVRPDDRDPLKFMAKTLVREGDEPPQPQEEANEDSETKEFLSGTVAEWNNERGFGFVQVDDGRRAYVHHSAFGGGSLLQGLPCDVVLVPDQVNIGKWKASEIYGECVQSRADGEPLSKRPRL